MSANSQTHTVFCVFENNEWYSLHRRNRKVSENNNKQVVARRAKNKREIVLSLFRSYLSLFLLCAQHNHPDCYCRADAVKDKCQRSQSHGLLFIVFKYVVMEYDGHLVACFFHIRMIIRIIQSYLTLRISANSHLLQSGKIE